MQPAHPRRLAGLVAVAAILGPVARFNRPWRPQATTEPVVVGVVEQAATTTAPAERVEPEVLDFPLGSPILAGAGVVALLVLWGLMAVLPGLPGTRFMVVPGVVGQSLEPVARLPKVGVLVVEALAACQRQQILAAAVVVRQETPVRQAATVRRAMCYSLGNLT